MAKKEGIQRKSSPQKRKKRSGKKKKQVRISIWIVIAALTVLAALVSLPYMKNGSPEKKGARIPPGAFSYGIDISYYQDKVECDSLMVMTDAKGRTISSITHAKDVRPVSYVLIKATEGVSMKDRMFSSHWKEAEKKNVRRGAYHFFRSSKDPLEQAGHFIETVGNLRYKDLPPVLDIETIHKGCSREELNSKALIWLKEVESHYGRKPIVYANPHYLKNILSPQITQNYPIWVANYEVSRPSYKRWHMWQFTDRALVKGVGSVDLNVMSVPKDRH
jgi:GH25 family lysozyme M1 (1,4-beta-N-acetylmuramidase)